MYKILELVKNPIFFKVTAFSILGPESILLLSRITTSIINYSLVLWAIAILIWDVFHEKRFLQGKFSPLLLLLFSSLALTNIVNYFVHQISVISIVSQLSMVAILFFIFASPSHEWDKEKHKRELSVISLSVVITMLPIILISTSAYFLRFNLYLPLSSRWTYEIAGEVFNVNWRYNFFSLFDNPNFVSSYMVVVFVCAVLVLFLPLKRFRLLQIILCIVAMFCSMTVFIASQNRGDTLALIVGSFALTFILSHRILVKNSIKSIYALFTIPSFAGVCVALITFLMLSFSSLTLPNVAVRTSSVYEYLVLSMQRWREGDQEIGVAYEHAYDPVCEPSYELVNEPVPVIQPFAETIIPREVALVDASGSGRIEIWEMYIRGIDLFLLIFGGGTGNRLSHYERFYSNHPERHFELNNRWSLTISDPQGNVFVTSAHNEFLELLIYNGVVTMLLFLLIVTIVGIYALGMSLSSNIDSENFRIVIVIIFFSVAALVKGLTLAMIFRFTLYSLFVWSLVGYATVFTSKYKITWIENALKTIRSITIYKVFPYMKTECNVHDLSEIDGT